MEAPDDFDFGSGARSLVAPARKRKSTAGTDPEDHALRTKAWAGNRGLVGHSSPALLRPLVVFHTPQDDLSTLNRTLRRSWCLSSHEEMLTSKTNRCPRRTMISRSPRRETKQIRRRELRNRLSWTSFAPHHETTRPIYLNASQECTFDKSTQRNINI